MNIHVQDSINHGEIESKRILSRYFHTPRTITCDITMHVTYLPQKYFNPSLFYFYQLLRAT